MARIQLGGAGGAPTNNVIRSLRASGRGDHLIGQSSSAADLFLADVDEAHLVPVAHDPGYPEALLTLLRATRPDWLHLQRDSEVRAVARMRDDVEALGVRLFLPDLPAIETCVDKWRSYVAWRDAGLPVPETLLLAEPADVGGAMAELGPRVWLRATEGAGGHGAIATDDPAFACAWIERNDGWGRYTAARLLTPHSVAWMSIWHEGELVVAQTRFRRGWAFADRAPAGVTGVTAVGVTGADPRVDEVAEGAVRAVSTRPHGLYGVDMTFDDRDAPQLTEINIGRFFTTIHFFTSAGLNFPAIARDLALGVEPELPSRRLNPLPPGLTWIRGMDVEPRLVREEDLDALQRSGSLSPGEAGPSRA